MADFEAMRSLVLVTSIASLLACGEPPTAPAAPGKMNTGGRPTPETRTNTEGKGDTETNAGGKPTDRQKSANRPEGARGRHRREPRRRPDFSKTTFRRFGRDGGK